MYCYKCVTNDLDFKLNVHKDFKWLKREELNLLDWAPADLPIVKKLMEE
jgi:8-oxo-dGTP diphosphatase